MERQKAKSVPREIVIPERLFVRLLEKRNGRPQMDPVRMDDSQPVQFGLEAGDYRCEHTDTAVRLGLSMTTGRLYCIIIVGIDAVYHLDTSTPKPAFQWGGCTGAR